MTPVAGVMDLVAVEVGAEEGTSTVWCTSQDIWKGVKGKRGRRSASGGRNIYASSAVDVCIPIVGYIPL